MEDKWEVHDVRRTRNWGFTDFEDIDWKTLWKNNDEIRYIGWGKEICPESKREHNQGWLQMEKPKGLRKMKKIIGSDKIHLFSCRGTEEQNVAYCSKDNQFQYTGCYKVQGQRTDLLDIKKEIDEGATMDDVMEKNLPTYCRYRRGLRDYYEMVTKKRASKPREMVVEFIHGATGTGKTTYAMDESNGPVYKITGDELQWWCGYEGEKTLVIDEYDNNVPITRMLNLLDKWRLRLPIKGGYTWAEWNKVIITSNLTPDELHSRAKMAHRKALFRRITTIKELFENAQGAQG